MDRVDFSLHQSCCSQPTGQCRLRREAGKVVLPESTQLQLNRLWYYALLGRKLGNIRYQSFPFNWVISTITNLNFLEQLNSSQANLEAAKTFARGFIANSSQWAAEIGKPVFLDEFGMARNNLENADKEYQYLSSAGTSNKDEYFEVSLSETSLAPHPPLITPRADHHRSSNGQIQRPQGSLRRNLSVGVWRNLPFRDSACQ